MIQQKGPIKKHVQKYKNKTAFKVTFNDTYQRATNQVQFDGLCQPCKSQIEWKIQYGKYKIPNGISRCQKCEQKTIFKAYHKLCDKCADELQVCAKCVDIIEIDENNEEQTTTKLNSKDKQNMESFMHGLRERSRRALQRRLDADEILWCKEKECFIEMESGKQLEGLKFKQNYMDEEDEDLWNDCDDEDDNDEKEEDEDEDSEDEKVDQNKEQVPIKQVKQTEIKQIQQTYQLQKIRNNDNKDQDNDDDNDFDDDSDDEFLMCREVISDGSNDLEKFYRTQKNYKYYFNIKNYPDEDEPNSDE